jgi:hypothetical protein
MRARNGKEKPQMSRVTDLASQFRLLAFLLFCPSFGFGQAYSSVEIDVRQFSGATVGAQIQSAHDSSRCPTSGCVIDVRSIGATATINSLNITKPIKLLFGATTFTVNGTLLFSNITGGDIEGAGRGVTTFIWRGNNSSAMFRLVSVAKSTFRGFTVNASRAIPLTAFFTSERGTSGNPTGNAFYDAFGTGTNGGVTDGFRWVIGPGGDKGNDIFVFTRVNFANYSNAGWNNSGSTQSQGHTFVDCATSGNGFGRYGYYGIGSLAMYNTQFGGNTVADAFITGINNGVLISGGLSIGSNRLYDEASATSNRFTVTIEQFNFANTALNADGKVTIFRQRGPYLLLNDSVSGSSVKPSQFHLAPRGAEGLVAIAIGNGVATNLANPFTGSTWQTIGNAINTGPPSIVGDVFPKLQNCGTTSICSGMTLTGAQFVIGKVTLSEGTAIVTGISPAFASTSTYSCIANDLTIATNGSNAIPISTSSIRVTGTGRDLIVFHCAGN